MLAIEPPTWLNVGQSTKKKNLRKTKDSLGRVVGSGLGLGGGSCCLLIFTNFRYINHVGTSAPGDQRRHEGPVLCSPCCMFQF